MPQLFRILDFQYAPRQNEVMNRYWFDTADDGINAVDVALAFGEQFVDLVRLIQSEEYEHIAIFVEDVLQPSNSALVTVLNGEGSVSGDAGTAFSAWSFPMKPIGPVIKRGGKRIPGVAELWSDDDVVLPGTPSAIVEAFAAVLLAPLQVSGSDLFPAIVRAIGEGAPSEYLVSLVVGAIFRQIGSQVSRKLSRGGGSSLSGMIGFQLDEFTAADYTSLLEADYVEAIETALIGRVPATTPYEVTRTVG
jgi:hypothetical protein